MEERSGEMRNESISIGVGSRVARLPLSRLNRHMLITGATGSGKTVSLIGMVERLAQAGVPVFLPDVKGDLAAIGGVPCRRLEPFRMSADLLDPATVSAALGLSATQAATLEIVWSVGMRLGSFKSLDDVRSVARTLESNASLAADLGRVSPVSLSVILRALLAFERSGGRALFGEPFDVARLVDLAADGRGLVNVFPAAALISSPSLYALALLYVLDEMTTRFPECGDLDRPRVAVVIDEAHLLFEESTPETVRAIVRKVRLLRSKGVALIFASQSPGDLPTELLAQLANRVQHRLGAASAADLRAVKIAAETLPPNGSDLVATIKGLAIGCALVSFVDPAGVPSVPIVVQMPPPSAVATSEAVPLIDPATPATGDTVAGRHDFTAGLVIIGGALALLAKIVAWSIG